MPCSDCSALHEVPIRNMPKNNVVKVNITLFLKTVNKAISAWAKKSRIAIMLNDLFHDLLRVTNFDCKKIKILISKGKVYLYYKIITSQNVPSVAQVNDFFIL